MRNVFFLFMTLMIPCAAPAEEPSVLGFIKDVASPYVDQAQKKAESAHEAAVDYTSQAMDWTQEDLANYGRWFYKTETVSLDNVKTVED